MALLQKVRHFFLLNCLSSYLLIDLWSGRSAIHAHVDQLGCFSCHRHLVTLEQKTILDFIITIEAINLATDILGSPTLHSDRTHSYISGRQSYRHTIGSRGSCPLAPKIFSKSCSFQTILRGKDPYFEQILGPPLGPNSVGPP